MTMIVDGKLKCAVCNHEGNYPMLLSTNCMGPSDLDTRPAPMERDTLSEQIHICPKCGYSAYYINRLKYPNSCEIIKSKDYQKILNSNLYEAAKGFNLFAMIAEKNNDYEVAGYSFLKAAWVCDDHRDKAMAIEFRKKTIENYLRVLDKKESDMVKIVLLDLYRRTGQFEKVFDFAARIKFSEESKILNATKDWQIKLSQMKDDRCHDFSLIRKSN